MTTPTTDQPVILDWLAAAEAAHQEQKIGIVAQVLQRAQRHAALINARLDDFGIEPIEAASLDDRGNLRLAWLSQPEFEPYTYYEVRATWSEDEPLARPLRPAQLRRSRRSAQGHQALAGKTECRR
ncbi:hypothetical protein ACWGIA_21460 [Streptomyces bobili]